MHDLVVRWRPSSYANGKISTYLCLSILIIEIVQKYMYMMLDLKTQQIQSCEHIQVPGSSDKWASTVYTYMKHMYVEHNYIYTQRSTLKL